jgi:hypothetical protein
MRRTRPGGGARGVLDLRDGAGRHRRQPDVGAGAAGEPLPLRQPHHVPQCGKPGPDLLQRRLQRCTPVLGGQEDAGGPGVSQHVAQLTRAQRRVDRHQGEAGQRGAELEQQPLRAAGRPDGDPLAGIEPRQQRGGCPFRLGEQLGERPAPANRIAGLGEHQRGPVGCCPGSRLQHPANGCLRHWLGGVGRPVRLKQSRVLADHGASFGPRPTGCIPELRDSCRPPAA